MGLSTLGAYAVGGQRPPGFDRWPDAKKLVIGMVDGKEIEAAWKSGHPWKAGGMGAGGAASMFLCPGGKAGKAARAEAEAGAGLRGEARAGGRTVGEPNRLPKAENARIDPRKFGDYALNPDHPKNEGKWRAFDQLGYDVQSGSGRQAATDDVMNQIRAKLPDSEAMPVRGSAFGSRFEVDVTITGPNGKTGTLVTIWQIDKGGDSARLITTYLWVHR